MTGFKRARSEEQREERRRAILDAAAAMLDEMPASDVSLNELSRRVGLAKSNVLRYFESREAILLELLDQHWKQWLAGLDAKVEGPGGDGSASGDGPAGGPGSVGSLRERGDRLADVLADSLAPRHVLCDLLTAQSGVLEHNVSTDVAVRFKRASLDNVGVLSALVRRPLPELGDDGAVRLAVMSLALVTAAWPATRPSASVLCAYETEPSLAVLRIDFRTALREGIATAVSGILARQAG